MMTHLSLFSGIGGLDLAAEWAGFTTVGQCEWADYPTKVLEKHWPDVPKWRDIKTLTGGDFYERTGLRTVDVVSGGFPCQPFSVAGNQKGKSDDRYLWPEMLRIITELAPRWVVGENVPGILNIAADDVCADLERAGYEVGIFDYEAAAVGALHRRERIAFVGHAKHDGSFAAAVSGCSASTSGWGAEREKAPGESARTGGRNNDAYVADANGAQRGQERGERYGLAELPNSVQKRTQSAGRLKRGGTDVADALCDGSAAGVTDTQTGEAREPTEFIHASEIDTDPDEPRLEGQRNQHRLPKSGRKTPIGRSGWWAVEPNVGRVAYGIPARVDRLRGLGNAVVPQQFYPIFAAIAAEIAMEVLL